MSRRDGDGGDALIVILDPKEQTGERVSVSDLTSDQAPASCLHLFAPASGALEILSCAGDKFLSTEIQARVQYGM